MSKESADIDKDDTGYWNIIGQSSCSTLAENDGYRRGNDPIFFKIS